MKQILLVERKTQLGSVVSCEILEGHFAYYGPLLKTTQIDNIVNHPCHNTVINKQILTRLGKTKLLEEVERLTGIKCRVKVIEHNDEYLKDTVIIERIPYYLLDTMQDSTNYYLYDHDDLIDTFSKREPISTLQNRIREMGYKPLKVL